MKKGSLREAGPLAQLVCTNYQKQRERERKRQRESRGFRSIYMPQRSCLLIGHAVCPHHDVHDEHVIIKSCSFTLYLHPSLSSIAPGRSSKWHPVSGQDIYKFLLVGQHLHVYVKRSIEEGHLWVRHYFFSGVSCVLFISPEWFYRWEAIDHTAVVSWGVASGICSG